MATTLTENNQEYIPKQWEQVPCVFCGSEKSKPHEKYGPQHRYTYVQCLECDLVYANPRPVYDEEFVHTAYDVYQMNHHHVVRPGELSAQETQQIKRYETTLKQLESLLGRKGKILDIGCETGLFLIAAKQRGWEGVGLDVSKGMTEHIQSTYGIRTYCGQYHAQDFGTEGKFDVIYASHVLEHIPNPNEWLRKFRMDLRDDGLVCLNIPNQYSWDRVFKRTLKKLRLKKDRWTLWRTPDHLYEPHLKPMQILLNKHGYKILESFTYSRAETDTPRPIDVLLHHRWKIGSKLRLIARP